MYEEYVITDGNKFINKDFGNNIRVVNDVALAITFNTKKQAQGTWNFELPMNLKTTFYVAKVDGTELLPVSVPSKVKRKDEIEKAIENGKDLEDEGYVVNNNRHLRAPQITRWTEPFKLMKNMKEEVVKRKYEISKEKTRIEEMLTDVQHCIEFKNFGTYNGYLINKVESELKRKRRILKDEQCIVEAICKHLDIFEAVNEVNEIMKLQDERVYKPRALDDLFKDSNSFENCIKKVLNDLSVDEIDNGKVGEISA